MVTASFKQNLIWRVEALAYDCVSILLNLFPFSWVSALGGRLVQLIGPLTSKQKIARRSLEIAFPEKSDKDINTLLHQQWNNIGRSTLFSINNGIILAVHLPSFLSCTASKPLRAVVSILPIGKLWRRF